MNLTSADPVRFERFVLALKGQLRNASDRSSARTSGSNSQSNQLRPRFATFLRSLATAVKAGGPLGIATPVHQDQAASDRFAATIAEIKTNVAKRIQATLGHSGIAALRSQLQADRKFLDILGMFEKSRDENANSSMIRFLLDPATAPTIAPYLLRRLVEHLELPVAWGAALERAISDGCLSVFRERVLKDEGADEGNLDRIDILITGPNFLIAIENKVDSLEHTDQTHDYWAWLERRRRTGFFIAGLFLSPTGINAQCECFKSASYLDLLAWLVESPVEEVQERIVLESYLRSVIRLVSFPTSSLHPVWSTP